MMADVSFRKDPVFGFDVPVTCPGVDSRLLSPRDLWADTAAYDEKQRVLADKFRTAFGAFRNIVKPEVAAAGP
jgi:phosphoenolpyruvate carboxykinase (ATP)